MLRSQSEYKYYVNNTYCSPDPISSSNAAARADEELSSLKKEFARDQEKTRKEVKELEDSFARDQEKTRISDLLLRKELQDLKSQKEKEQKEKEELKNKNRELMNKITGIRNGLKNTDGQRTGAGTNDLPGKEVYG
jgi:hypothetical protein